VEAKRFEYVASLERDGSVRAEGGSPITLDPTWKPEHLLLAAVPRCTLKSLRYFARDASITASAEVAGVVSRREEDGLYALLEVEVVLNIEIDPLPTSEELSALLARAERGCFVGNSLTAKPSYVWRVNGQLKEPAR
jgi:organic hydroperoxide reductase OsmC/OhrA